MPEFSSRLSGKIRKSVVVQILLDSRCSLDSWQAQIRFALHFVQNSSREISIERRKIYV